MRKIYANCPWRVITDPLPLGGFEPGTRFSNDEIIHMLRYRSFTIGTVLLHGQKGRFVVERGANQYDSLRLVNSQKVLLAQGQRLIVDETKMDAVVQVE